MEIKTKFNLGDKVWYVKYCAYLHDEECPICGEYVSSHMPSGILEGEIIKIYLDDEILYNIAVEKYGDGKYLYVERMETEVFATDKEAQKAYEGDLEKHKKEKKEEKKRILKWVKDNYGE